MPTTVFFATNRHLTGDPAAPDSYGPDIQQAALTYGTAFVNGVDIKADEQGGITSIQDTNHGTFAPGPAADLAAGGRNLLVFLHGFANNFRDAITRAAFVRDFLAESYLPGTDATVIAFAWPSLGKVVGFPDLDAHYQRDLRTAQDSAPHLMRFFAELQPLLQAARARGNRTCLLAHSMGGLALQGAVKSWFASGNGPAHLFDTAILAAADCAADAFAQPGLSDLPTLARHVSVYFSESDAVLKIARTLTGHQRLGQQGPTPMPPAPLRLFDATGIDDYDTGFLASHQYYRRSPTVRAAIAADMAAARA
jgi:hypothetical protein